MTAAIILFLLPISFREREFTMNWETVNKMPWGILILFGGGLSLAAAVQANGVAEFIGSYAGKFGNLPTLLTVLIVTASIVFLTELTSNVATTTSLVSRAGSNRTGRWHPSLSPDRASDGSR